MRGFHFGRHRCGPDMHAMRRGPFGGFDREEGHGPGRGPRGGRRRMFDGGELRLVLLKLIEEQPRHGYDLIKEIENRTGGAYAPSPGVVYPTMTLLIDMDLAEEQASEGARKLLSITDAGRTHLAENAVQVDEIMERLSALGKMSERTDAAPVRRAMHNLKVVLQERLSHENANRDLQLEIARLIDEAASKIERL